jgi:hypothetical protein
MQTTVHLPSPALRASKRTDNTRESLKQPADGFCKADSKGNLEALYAKAKDSANKSKSKSRTRHGCIEATETGQLNSRRFPGSKQLCLDA